MAFGKSSRRSKSTGPGTESHRLFQKRRDSVGFPWHRVDRSLLAAMFDAATSNGAAVFIGGTQGGRGIVVTVYIGDERAKEYASTEEEFADLAIEVIQELQGPSQDYFAAYGIDHADAEVADD